MQCVCCLHKSENKKIFSAFTASDRKLYVEFTKLEINLRSRHKICGDCKTLLRTSAEFFQLCIKSHEQQNADATEKVEVHLKRTSRRKVKQEPGNESIQDLPDNDDEDSADDEQPISCLVKQLQNDIETVVKTLESPLNKPQESIEENQDSLNDAKKKINKFLCTDCGVSFSTSQRLQVHSYTHSGIKNWKCDHCDKVFATKFRLRAHTRTHTGERPFACDICSIRFAQGSALKCHKRIHTKERPFVCKVCSKSFSQNTTLKTHMVALHLGKEVACDEPGCDKKFTRRSYLLIHKRDHAGERNYACERCPNQYKQKSHLDRHIEASHLGIRHKCTFPGCTSEFSKSWSLKMHKFVHTPENSLLPYQCETCEAGFQRRDKLLKHRSKSHPNEKGDLKANSIEIPIPKIEVGVVTNENPNYVVLTSSPEIYTIQNSDGSYTQVQTLQVIQEN